MNKEQLYEKIEAYLGEEMPASEQESFEKELAADTELQQELALHRKLHRELGRTDKARLREQLQHLSREFPPEAEGNKRPSWNWPLLLLLAALIGLSIWWVQRDSAAGTTEELPAAPEEQAAQESIAPEDNLSNGRQSPPQEPEGSKPEKTTPGQLPQAEKPGNPFQPSPELESLAATKIRDANYLVSAAAGATPTADGNYQITVAGTLRSGKLGEDGRLFLSIYNNAVSDYGQGRPLARIPLQLELLEEEEVYAFASPKTYTFEQKVEQKLPQGLYYYVISRAGQESTLFVGKVEAGDQ